MMLANEKSSFLSATFTRTIASRCNVEHFLYTNSGARCVHLEMNRNRIDIKLTVAKKLIIIIWDIHPKDDHVINNDK